MITVLTIVARVMKLFDETYWLIQIFLDVLNVTLQPLFGGTSFIGNMR